MKHVIKSDFLIIGSGVAGLSLAIKLADIGTVNLISKQDITEGNTRYAQGGIASVISSKDSFKKHTQDTLIAGDGLCHEDAVKKVVEEAPDRIKELIEWGVNFSKKKNSNAFDLAKEAAHSEARILHSNDFTGLEIMQKLCRIAKQHPNISIYEYHFAVELITEHHVLGNLQAAFNICFGAYIFNEKKQAISPFQSNYTILASGGASGAFQYSTNPAVSTGDGVAMAYRAGVRVAGMEFVQFHPTTLYDLSSKDKNFLISEALRGFGGHLVDEEGNRFMHHYDERMELAPRDIVARAIDSEVKKRRIEHVNLSMLHLDKDEVKERFPNIYKYVLEALNIDITQTLIPVVPAAHYTCGGVMTSLTGQTSMQNLFACGEVAHTGVHGANRLASNSLMEALVFGNAITMKIAGKRKRRFSQSYKDIFIPEWDETGVKNHYEWTLIRHNFKEIKHLMWDYVGIVRSKKQLERAYRRLRVIHEEVEDYYKRSTATSDLLELRNLSTVAHIIVRSALRRNESRGLHYMLDFPNKDDKFLKDTII